MKKYFLAALVLFAAALGTAHAQSFSAPINGKPGERVQRFAPLTTRGEIGAFPRGFRGGNPLQIFNPRAPRRYYGAPEDTVTYDPFNPSHITGLILFGIVW